jgi:hypothetical protein
MRLAAIRFAMHAQPKCAAVTQRALLDLLRPSVRAGRARPAVDAPSPRGSVEAEIDFTDDGAIATWRWFASDGAPRPRFDVSGYDDLVRWLDFGAA